MLNSSVKYSGIISDLLCKYEMIRILPAIFADGCVKGVDSIDLKLESVD